MEAKKGLCVSRSEARLILRSGMCLVGKEVVRRHSKRLGGWAWLGRRGGREDEGNSSLTTPKDVAGSGP